MEAIMNLLMGEPVYDDNGKIVRRDFGPKNIIAIGVVVLLGYYLMNTMNTMNMNGRPILSGKKKGKKIQGGGGLGWNILKVVAAICALVGLWAWAFGVNATGSQTGTLGVSP